MASGYIKLHRSLLDNHIFSNEKILRTWIWCLFKATHKEHSLMVGLQKITLQPGQFIFGREAASNELKMHQSSIYRIMKKLQDNQSLNIKPNNKFSVVTIVNWDIYQVDNTFIEQQMNNKRTTNEQQMNTNKNVKNVKNVKNKDLKTLERFENKNEIMFDEFWRAYPNKKSKGHAEKAWNKIKPDEQLLTTILDALKRAKTSVDWTKDNGQFIPHPATWLNGRRWEDEYQGKGKLPEGFNGINNWAKNRGLAFDRS